MKAKKIIKALKELKRICEVRKGCTSCPFLKKNNTDYNEHCALSQLYDMRDWKLLKKQIRRLF